MLRVSYLRRPKLLFPPTPIGPKLIKIHPPLLNVSSNEKTENSRLRLFFENHPVLTCVFGCSLLVSAISCGYFVGSTDFSVPLTAYSANGFAESQISTNPESLKMPAVTLVAMITVLVTILLGWTLWVLVKSLRSQRQIATKNKELEKAISESEEANKELRETHRMLISKDSQLGGFLEGTSDLIAAIDSEYQLLSYNHSYKQEIENHFGIEIEPGVNIIEAQRRIPEMARSSKDLWDRALEGESHVSEQFSQTSDGSFRYYEITYNPIRNSEGEITGACQIARDSTERILTAENLKKERDFVNAAFEVSSALVFVLDREGRIVRFNRACELASGFSLSEVRGRVFWNVLLPAEEIQKAKTKIRKLSDEGPTTDSWQCHWITKSEQQILISWQTSTILDEDGRVEFVVATGIDVTEKQEIESSKNRMLDILENSDDFISISDLHGNIDYLNRAGRMLLGLSNEADISKLRLQGCHPDWAREVIQTEGIPAAAKYGSWLGNTALKTIDNVEIPTSHMILSHKDSDGRIKYLSTVARNRTSEKLLEEELAAARDTAIQATNLKSEFLANMSHEIRTPMNGIIGIAELLRSTEMSDEQRDYVESITKSGEALLTIINDILDFSKIEAGKLELESKPFSVNECAEGVIDLFTHQAQAKGVELDLLINTSVPATLNGDVGRIRQVLTNLVGNAVKFTKSGSVILRINSNESSLKFEIKDTGIGISVEDQEELFKAFSQANSTIASRFGGTGLGLAISEQLVSMMGGEIEVESEENVGSVFRFTIPFPRSTASDKQSYPNLRNSALRRILVVHEDLELGSNMIYRLKAMSLAAELAVSADEGVQLVSAASELNEPFDAVVIDGKVSNLNKLREHIGSRPRYRKTKVYISVYPEDKEIFDNESDWNTAGFVAKPVKTRGLVKALTGKSTMPPLPVGRVEEPVNYAAEAQHSEEKSSLLPILIAEDNLVNQTVILNQVSRLGYEVELVSNGQEAVTLLEKNDYSLILMDCQMPVMDGFEATKTIRDFDDESKASIPIVAVTAHAISGDRERCLEMGMDDYISKPTDQKTLKRVLENWITSAGHSPPEKPAPEQFEEDDSEESNTEPAQNTDQKETRSEEAKILSRLTDLGDACGSEVVNECVSLFLNDSIAAFNNLEKAITSLDFEELAREAHKLKGSAANMGATRLPKICENLMRKAEQTDEMRSRLLIKGIAAEIRFLHPVYKEIIKSADSKERVPVQAD